MTRSSERPLVAPRRLRRADRAPRLLPRLVALTLLLAATAPRPAAAQAAGGAPPAADPADVSSVDAILTAVYEAISGPAGEPRDWERFHSLFAPGARLMPTVRPEPGAAWRVAVWTPAEYAERAGPSLERNGFFETEIHRTEERYGPIVHAFSTYESRLAADEPDPFQRGINSFQLLDDGERWWIVSIYWHGETPQTPIPASYLPAAGVGAASAGEGR